MKKLFFLLFLISLSSGFAQNVTQTIRGTITDKDAKYPLPGATVVLLTDSVNLKAVSTDEKGQFRLTGVSIGRHIIKATFVGYKDVKLNNVIVTSAKETILNFEMEEFAVELGDVEITATRSGMALNDMAAVSSRAFTVEETDRFAGSRGDPARMASNFAGVQGADDSRNDIVIRGNSPQGVLWRLEGINIPNPNHFNIPGTAGGPVSIINNKMLANSDFFTGAFPAEFGNSIAGVFDLRLRSGNNEKHEFSGQFGFLGTELFGEGPLSRSKGSSYMFTYRYSTLALFSTLGINIGTNAIPQYQDASFKINMPGKKGGNLSVFGIAGNSKIDILISDQKKPEVNIYGENDRDQYFKSRMGILGISYTKTLPGNAFIRSALSASHESVNAHHEFIYRQVKSNGEYQVDSLKNILRYDFGVNKYSYVFNYFKKLNNKNTIMAGVNNDLYGINFQDSVRNLVENTPGYNTYQKRWASKDHPLLTQGYVQLKHKFDEKLQLMAGLHTQYFTLGNSFSPIEPRVGLTYNVSAKHILNFGAGLHSQIQSPYLYYYAPRQADGSMNTYNKGMGFTKSWQIATGYDFFSSGNTHIKTEVYYQSLFQIPVSQKPSSFSLVNTGAGFSRFFPDTLVNKGTGENYGIELTVERFFSKKFFFMITGSLFESKYKGSDGIKRDTDFNGNYAINALITREFAINKNNSFGVGGKVTAVGGRRYGPVDSEASEKAREVIFVDSQRNSLQFRDYFRADMRLNYKVNRPKVTHEIALDLVNLLNTKNILKLTLAPDPDDATKYIVRKEYQLGFLPLFYYKVDF